MPTSCARIIIPAFLLITAGMVAICQGRRMVKVGYEVSGLKSDIARTAERNIQLAVQGSKLRSPARVLELARTLDLKMAGRCKQPPATPERNTRSGSGVSR